MSEGATTQQSSSFFPQLPIEPVAAGTSLIDTDEVFGFRWPLADALIDVTLPCPHGAQGGDLRAMILGDIRYGNRILVDIHADKECAETGTWLAAELRVDVATSCGGVYLKVLQIQARMASVVSPVLPWGLPVGLGGLPRLEEQRS